MPQAPTSDPLAEAFHTAQESVRRSRSAAREAARDLARFRDELEARGIKLVEKPQPQGKGDA